MTCDEGAALSDQASWRPLDLVIAMLRAPSDHAQRPGIAAMGMAFIAFQRAQPSSPQQATDQLLEELAKTKCALDVAAQGDALVLRITTRLLTVARRVAADAAISSVEWATTADVAEALLQEAARSDGREAV